MPAAQLKKWLAFYAPLLRGRFDFFISAGAPRRDAWHQALALTGGRFWVRVRGGHNLRRRAGTGSPPGAGDPIVGRADGRTASAATFPWVGHPADSSFTYALSVVGAGGVEDLVGAPISVARFDAAGALVAPAPNAVQELSVAAESGGRFRLSWMYDETNQERPPTEFRVYNDAASPRTVDYAAPIAAAAYRFRRGHFSWTSAAFAHGARIRWAVRAAAADGMLSPIGAEIIAVAVSNGPPVPPALFAVPLTD